MRDNHHHYEMKDVLEQLERDRKSGALTEAISAQKSVLYGLNGKGEIERTVRNSIPLDTKTRRC